MLSMQIPYTIPLIYNTLYFHFKKQVQYSDEKYVNIAPVYGTTTTNGYLYSRAISGILSSRKRGRGCP